MKRLRMVLASAIILTAASGIFASSPAEGEDLFKWGEYDSLIRMLEPATRNGTLAELKTSVDSAARARSFMFLGVALFATGKPAKADNAFQKACDLDPEVKLDRFYVTEEIANHFQAIAMEGIRRRPRKSAAASTVAMDAAPGSRDGNPGSRNHRLEAQNGKAWLWWGLGVTAAVAVGGGAMYFAGRDEGGKDSVTVIDAGSGK
ncbi:MAG: tetratricopeptide repeat protein [Fibrobacterota bacterium]|nr:tetratricopeptide repeat protein [Fibrobacterota bacterium]